MKTLKNIILSLVLCHAFFMDLEAAPFYFGSQSTEAKITFQAYVDVDATSLPSHSLALTEIQNQLKFIIGPMFNGEGGPQAAPWSSPEIEINSIVALPDMSSFRIEYTYLGKVVVQKGSSALTIFLPVHVNRFSEKILKRCRLWYVWYEWTPGYCGTRIGEDYLAIDVPLENFPNTVKTYPEYKRLVNSAREIKISVFVGSNKNQNPNWGDQFKSEYYAFDSWLRAQNFNGHRLSFEEIEKRVGDNSTWFPIMTEYTKDVGSYHLKVDLFYGNIELNGDSEAFHTEYLRALSESSVVIYAGHSGLGENLDYSLFAENKGTKVILNPKYQIFMVDSCLSYTHYGSMYFSSKAAGSIDFIGVGTEGYLGGRGVSLIRMIQDWAIGKEDRLSYQSLAALYPDYLFGIVGDEDNEILP